MCDDNRKNDIYKLFSFLVRGQLTCAYVCYFAVVEVHEQFTNNAAIINILAFQRLGMDKYAIWLFCVECNYPPVPYVTETRLCYSTSAKYNQEHISRYCNIHNIKKKPHVSLRLNYEQ